MIDIAPEWVAVIAAGVSAIGVIAVAVKEIIAWWNERPSIEAFLRPMSRSRVAVIIVNTGRRTAKRVQYTFIPQAETGKEVYTNFGCDLDFDTPSAPFTLVKEYPVKIWITSIYHAVDDEGLIMPPLQLEVTRESKFRNKIQVFDLDVRTLWNMSWSLARNKSSRRIEKQLGAISQRLGEIIIVLKRQQKNSE